MGREWGPAPPLRWDLDVGTDVNMGQCVPVTEEGAGLRVAPSSLRGELHVPVLPALADADKMNSLMWNKSRYTIFCLNFAVVFFSFALQTYRNLNHITDYRLPLQGYTLLTAQTTFFNTLKNVACVVYKLLWHFCLSKGFQMVDLICKIQCQKPHEQI